MPLEFDDLGLRLIGVGTRGLQFYDDNLALQAEIYLQADGTLNIQGEPGDGGGAGGGAPTDAIYLVLSMHDDLSNARVLVAGDGLTQIDGGARNNYTLSLDWGIPTIDTIEPDDAAAAGGSTNPARSDHTHGIVAAVAGTIEPDDSASEGAATSFARSDHQHAIVAAVVGTIQPDDSAAEGAATSFARSDHAHAIVGAAPAADSVNVAASAEGNATSFARSNHTHNLDESITPVWTGQHQFDADIQFVGAQSITSTADNLTLAPAGDLILNPTGDDVLPSLNYDINLGALTKKYLTLHAAELWVETLVAQDTIATIGGRILVGPTTVLTSDLGDGVGDTTIEAKHNEMANGDRVYLEANGKVEFMSIDSAPGGGGPYTYTVTRNLDGSGRNLWYAGDAVFNTGTTDEGFIDLYSVHGIKAGTEHGPTIVGNVRNSATYNDWTEHWAIGQLNGVYGYGVSTWGVGLGEFAAGQPHLTVDSTNGIRIFDGETTIIGQWDAAGNIVVGQVAASKSNVLITAGALSVRNNITERIGLTAAGILTIKDSGGAAVITLDAAVGAEITKKLTMPGASSAISIGAVPPTSTAVGTGIWIDRTGIYGLVANVLQAKFDGVTGALTAGAGKVVLDADGIGVTAGSAAYEITEAYKLYLSNGTTLAGYLGLIVSGGDQFLQLRAAEIAGENTTLDLRAVAPAGKVSTVTLAAEIDGTAAYLTLDGRGWAILSGADLRVATGLYVGGIGTTPDADDVHFDGNLKSMKNATFYDVYGHTRLDFALESVAWDGDAYSTTAKTLIDLSAVFGAPPGIKEVTLYVECRDSGSGAADCYIILSPNNTVNNGVVVSPYGNANDIPMRQTITVPCDANGDIYYQIVATGAGRFDVWLRIWGYDI